MVLEGDFKNAKLRVAALEMVLEGEFKNAKLRVAAKSSDGMPGNNQAACN